jgi:hypothetical protein
MFWATLQNVVVCYISQGIIYLTHTVLDSIRVAIIEAGAAAKIVKLLNHPGKAVYQSTVMMLTEIAEYGKLSCLSMDSLLD